VGDGFLTRLDEFSLIRMLTANKQSKTLLHKHGVSVGIGDDAAVASISSGHQLVMSCDSMVDGVHFHRWTMRDEDIGFKSLAANVSDMASMGAIPKYALISISVPNHFSDYRLKRIYKGIYECANLYDIAIVGGDTTASRREFMLSITIIGEVETNKALLRSTAKRGDQLFITGVLGRSAAGLDYLWQQQKTNLSIDHVPSEWRGLVAEHRKPRPSVEAGRILLRSNACRALNDISDGLASEAWEIADASHVSILLHENSLPIAADLAAYAQTRGKSPLDWILYGGEDYSLLGTLPPHQVQAVEKALQHAGLEFYIIGEVTDEMKKEVSILDQTGTMNRVEKKGYHHF